jgi:hypothetical protein
MDSQPTHLNCGAFNKNKPDNKIGTYNEQRYIKLLNAVGIDVPWVW